MPGYYSVPLRDRKVLAELTATERVGLHRYTFQSAGASHFVLDFAHSYNDPLSPVKDATLDIVGDDMITGGRTVLAWAKGRRIYFAAQFSKPFSRAEFWQQGAVLPAGTSRAAGHAIKAALHFDTSANEKILIRVGISGVSAANAMANLKAEMPQWEFEQTCATAKQKWQAELSRIHIETSDPTTRTIFYSSLYHMMVAPTLFDDVNGEYRGMDGKTHTTPAGPAQLQQLLFVGHVPSTPPGVHAVSKRPGTQPGELPD